MAANRVESLLILQRPNPLLNPAYQPGRHAVFIYVLCLFILAAMSLSMFGLSDRILMEQERVATVVTQTSRLSLQVQKVLSDIDRYKANPTATHRETLHTNVDELADQHQRIVATTAKAQDDIAAAARALDEIYFTTDDPLQPKLAGLIADASSLARVAPNAVRTSALADIDAEQYQTLVIDLDRAIYTYENKLQERMLTLQIWQRSALTIMLVILFLESLFIFIPTIRRMNAYSEMLRHMALNDTLTNIGNRRYFEARGTEEIQRARRHMQPLGLCLLDVDHFKLINDTYGHASGDRVLQDLTRVIINALRTEDILSRTGGEEFAILLPYADIRNASMVAERVRQAVRAATFVAEGGEHILLTVSIGVVMVNVENDTIDKSMEEADAAMYEAKFRGRNLTVVNHHGQFLTVGSSLWEDFLKVMR